MTNSSSDSFRNVTRYTGQDYRFVPTYLRNRDPITPATSPDIKPKEQQGHYPVSSLWTNTSNQNIWVLAGIISNLAKWVLISSGGSGPLIKIGVPLGTTPIQSDVNGLVNFTSTGASIQITGSAGGLGLQNINFDIAGGIPAIDKIAVDAFTPPGTNPVAPLAGQITLEGGVTYATGTRSKPIRTNSLAANTIDLEIQLAGSNPAISTANNFGVSQFDANQFLVASGFVQIIGGGTTGAITKINVDASSPPGTNPVVPVSGAITITGAQVGAGTTPNVIRTDSLAVNTFSIEIQRSQVSAGSNAANNGVSHFDNTRFTVDGNGFVSLLGTGVGETIRGDSGGFLAPSAGNWDILGLSGSKTSGSASTLTIKSPPYADQGGSTTVTLNSGSFATAAITLTLPASAGLADGDLFEFVCTTAGALIIQAVGTQKIRIGSLISSAAGTATSTSIGDSISLRFRAADGFFYATSVIGTWLIA